ncbi:MAG: DUF3038 domain-containing protein [Cyanobacteria bacterium]|nr:DUF3038 domain-containing protein [Cyanobacteria bacterium bin.51]
MANASLGESSLTQPPLTQRPAGARISRRGLERLDLMLLSVEALDLNGGEAMVWMAAQLGFGDLFPNRVELWKRRCYNPLRLACRRGELSEPETDALISLLCALADRLYPMLRQLLSSSEPEAVTDQRWGLFQGRLEELIRERLNPRRGGVQKLLDPAYGPQLRRQLIHGLAFGAGHGGFDRLKASLMDASA